MPGVGLTDSEAGSIVVLLALGVAISNANWRERVGEGGGETSLWSVSVSISSPVGGGGTTSEITVEPLRGGGDGRLSQSLLPVVAVWSAPQLMQRGGEEEQQPGTALELPPPGQVGLGHRCMARGWLREQMGQTGSVEGHLGATWP